MDLLASTDLELLAERTHDGTHLSLYLPTHRVGSEVQADRLGWKNLLTQTENVLTERGMRAPEISALLAPAWALHDDQIAWQNMSDGLGFFLRPGWHQAFRVPLEVPALASVGDRFLLAPLHPMVTRDNHFLLLAISQRRVRLLEGTRHRVEEVELRDVPTDLRQVVDPHEPRSDTMARLASTPVGGRSGRAVFYGHGAADEHVKKDEVRGFLRQVANGLRDILADQDLPLVPVGLDASLALYREVNSYRHLTEEGVRLNPDQMTAEELHAAVWPVIAGRVDAGQRAAARRFAELHGTGRASDDPQQIEQAARAGRVESLLVSAEPTWWQPDSSGARVVHLGDGGEFALGELIDRATVDTLSNGGSVYAVPASQIPHGTELAAVFRY